MEVITGSEGSSEKLLRKQPGGARWWSGRAWAEVEGCVGLVFRGVGVGVEVRGGEEEMGKGVPALAEAAAFLKAQRSPPPPATCGQWGMVRGGWCSGLVEGPNSAVALGVERSGHVGELWWKYDCQGLGRLGVGGKQEGASGRWPWF